MHRPMRSHWKNSSFKISGECVAVLPKSWVTTSQSWPNCGVCTRRLPLRLFEQPAEEGTSQAWKVVLTSHSGPFNTLKGHRSGPISMHGELFWQPEHSIRRCLAQDVSLWQGREGKKELACSKPSGLDVVLKGWPGSSVLWDVVGQTNYGWCKWFCPIHSLLIIYLEGPEVGVYR